MSKDLYFFYTWRNHAGLKCFGITGDLENLKRNYEGHTGIPIEFDHVWTGNETLIRDMEKRVKAEYWEYMFATDCGKYEWLNQDVPFDEFVNWVNWECNETYDNLITCTK